MQPKARHILPGREAANPYEAILVLENYMAEISKITGREHHLFKYYGDPEAEVIIAMGSVCETIEETGLSQS